MSAQMIPKSWPEDAEKTHEERMNLMNKTDFLKLRDEDPKMFVARFILIQPISLTFEGLTMKDNQTKLSIIGASPRLNRFNYYAPSYKAIGVNNPLSTYEAMEYMNHVYGTIAKNLPEPAYSEAQKAYEKYKNNPTKAFILRLQYKGKPVHISLADLITEELLQKVHLISEGQLQETRIYIQQFRKDMINNSLSLQESKPKQPLVSNSENGFFFLKILVILNKYFQESQMKLKRRRFP